MPKKIRLRIDNNDMYKEIARHTNFDVAQIKEVFYVYADLIKNLSISEHREEGFEIPLPKIGYFYFTKRKGRKKGSTYTMPKAFYRSQKEKINDDTDSPYFSLTLEEDEPDFETLSFKVYRDLNNIVKDSTRNKTLKDKQNG